MNADLTDFHGFFKLNIKLSVKIRLIRVHPRPI